ncbi:MAG: DUF1508 domain-containing protein [Treponema sp.]|nr:DUF1508 domain-containing protein [Treponema sp.]
MGKYVIHKSKKGFYFNIEATNGQVIAQAQVYSTKSSCKSAIEELKKWAKSPIEDLTAKNGPEYPSPKWQIYENREKEFCFRLVASNGNNLIWGEGYSTMQICKAGVLSVQANVNSEIEDKTLAEKSPTAKKPATKKPATKKVSTIVEEDDVEIGVLGGAFLAAMRKPATKKAPAKKVATKKSVSENAFTKEIRTDVPRAILECCD